MTATDTDLFNVVQFFEDETSEYVRSNVSAEEAVLTARDYCFSPGALLGITRRVIITDSGDCTVFDWVNGKGIVFPPPPGSDAP